MENKMKEVAQLLGVELDEEFKLCHVESNKELEGRYKLNKNNGLMFFDEYWRTWTGARFLQGLLIGTLTVVKLPWKPKEGQHYWTYFNNDWVVDTNTYYDGHAIHHIREKCGVIFRTKEEAIAARPAKYKELTGREWEE